jgi:phosphate transport system ATP-binding protein
MSGPKISTRKLNLHYRDFHALKDVTVEVPGKAITALIGPSGCGKSSLLRIFNRMNDVVPGAVVEGRVLLDSDNVYSGELPLTALRKRVGMVFQKPNPFPLSVYENVAYGPRIHGNPAKADVDAAVRRALEDTGLWDELKDRLENSALSLSAEQRQRLCISRLLANDPEVLLMDEPCSTLDPVATQRIEELFVRLKERYTIIVVTHNMQQAARISDWTGFMLLGQLLEFGATADVFTKPHHQKTQDYVTGRFG